MALGQIINSGSFVREPIYRKRLEWKNPSRIPGGMSDIDNHLLPAENSLYDVRLLGYRSHPSTNTDIGSIQQNSIGWALGVEDNIATYDQKGVITNNLVAVRNWLSYVRGQTDKYSYRRNPIIHYNNYEVVPAKVVGSSNEAGIQILDDITDEFIAYDPVENDIALFFNKETGGDHLVLTHASVLINVNSVYNFLDKPIELKWTSKMGAGVLVEHSIGFISNSYNNNSDYLIDMGMGFEEITQGSLQFLVKSKNGDINV